MSNLFDKLKKVAFKAGLAAAKDDRVIKAAESVKQTVDAFREGYREKRTPPETLTCKQCQATFPSPAEFCPRCGAKTSSA